MSIAAMAWAWEQDVPSGVKLVLLALADRANEDDGTCWPGLRRVAVKVGLTERVVRGHVAKLEELGLLRRETRTRADGSQTSSLIVLAFPLSPAAGGDAAGSRGGMLPTASRSEPSREPSSSASQKKNAREARSATEPDGFAEWMGYHSRVTTLLVLKAGTKARAHVAAMFAARLEEGYTVDELRAAVRGAYVDDYRREHGYVGAESVLRPTKIGQLIARGRDVPEPGEGKYDKWGD